MRQQPHGAGSDAVEVSRLRRRRSIAIAVLLAALVVAFYVITVVRGPGVLHS